MKPQLSFLLLLVFIVIISCTEKYHFRDLGQQTTIVITGLVTNEPGPYYVRVVENVSEISTGRITQRPINDARVTIESNGSVDELRSFYTVPVDSVWSIWERYLYFIDIPNGDGDYTRFQLEKSMWEDNKFHNDFREGAYFTTSTKGIPGHTYTLKVEYAGQEYLVTDYMCYGTVIDSMSVEPIGKYIIDKPDDTDGFMVPCLYFAEPQDEVNFYMFQVGAVTYRYEPNNRWNWVFDGFVPAKNLIINGWGGGGEDWYISVVSDRFMPPYVYQYKMSDGDHARKYMQGTDINFWPGWDNGGAIDMFCITEPVYRYYYALSRQYYEDGGAFSPSPASPPTNFTGGAQGCFSAASVSQYDLDLRKEKD